MLLVNIFKCMEGTNSNLSILKYRILNKFIFGLSLNAKNLVYCLHVGLVSRTES